MPLGTHLPFWEVPLKAFRGTVAFTKYKVKRLRLLNTHYCYINESIVRTFYSTNPLVPKLLSGGCSFQIVFWFRKSLFGSSLEAAYQVFASHGRWDQVIVIYHIVLWPAFHICSNPADISWFWSLIRKYLDIKPFCMNLNI